MVHTGIVIHADVWDTVKSLNPFSYLAGEAGKVVAGGWTAAMIGIWNAGLWLLRVALNFMDAFLVPDLSENGPAAQVYQTTFWIAGALVGLMTLVQLGVAAIRRDGRSLATVAIGTGQFIGVWVAGIAYGVLVVAACGGLTRALMSSMLHVDSWSLWQPWKEISTKNITDGTVATVLGVMGLFVILAAIGHFFVMLARGGALIVLAATTPISAAGLVADAGKTWFWKSLRWFHAAALSPVLTILVLGIGIKMTSGVAVGGADSTQKAIGTALPSVVLICIGIFAPMALFKLLAFVDPGTASGAGMRAGLNAMGGLSGLLGGKGSGASNGGANTGSAASTSDKDGKSQGESSGEEQATGRFQKMLGGLGPVASKTMDGMHSLGTKGAAIGTDLTNQMGVGHNTNQPDFSTAKQGKGKTDNKKSGDDKDTADTKGPGGNSDNGQGGGQDGATTPPTGPPPPTIGQGGPTPGQLGQSGDGPQAPGGSGQQDDQNAQDPAGQGSGGQQLAPPSDGQGIGGQSLIPTPNLSPPTADGQSGSGSSPGPSGPGKDGGGGGKGAGEGPGVGGGAGAGGGAGGAAAVPVA